MKKPPDRRIPGVLFIVACNSVAPFAICLHRLRAGLFLRLQQRPNHPAPPMVYPLLACLGALVLTQCKPV